MILKRRAILGYGDGHDKTISLLNRMITLEVDAGRRRVVYEPDPRHIEILLHQFGFGGKKAKGGAAVGVAQASSRALRLHVGPGEWWKPLGSAS